MVAKYVKHVVPFLSARTVNLKNQQSQLELERSLSKVKNQLGLNFVNDYANKDPEILDDKEWNLPLVQIPKASIEHEKIVLQEKFRFNIEDYPITKDELNRAPSDFPDSIYPIIKATEEPICTDYRKLKGPNNDLYSLGMLRGLIKQKPIHKCKWFSFNYFHSTTYAGKILKSRPAVMIICHNFSIFNTNLNVKGALPTSVQNRAYVFKYAINRTRMKKLYRKKFLDLYLEDKEYAKTFDGLYRFTCGLYPRTDDDIEDLIVNLKTCLRKVSNLDLDKAFKENDRKLPIYEINKIFTKNCVSVPFPSAKQKNWNTKK